MDSYWVELGTWLSRGLNINLRFLNRYVPHGGALFGSGETPLSQICHDYYLRGFLDSQYYRKALPCRVCNLVRKVTNVFSPLHVERARNDYDDIERRKD